MSIYPHDPDVPVGFQEADLEQAELDAEGDWIAAQHKRGICTHGWCLGPAPIDRSRAEIDEDRNRGEFPDRPTDPRISCQRDIPRGTALCLDCGQLIDDPFETD